MLLCLFCAVFGSIPLKSWWSNHNGSRNSQPTRDDGIGWRCMACAHPRAPQPLRRYPRGAHMPACCSPPPARAGHAATLRCASARARAAVPAMRRTGRRSRNAQARRACRFSTRRTCAGARESSSELYYFSYGKSGAGLRSGRLRRHRDEKKLRERAARCVQPRGRIGRRERGGGGKLERSNSAEMGDTRERDAEGAGVRARARTCARADECSPGGNASKRREGGARGAQRHGRAKTSQKARSQNRNRHQQTGAVCNVHFVCLALRDTQGDRHRSRCRASSACIVCY